MAALFHQYMYYEMCSWPKLAQIYMELPWTHFLIVTISRRGGTIQVSSFFRVSLTELGQKERRT